MLLSLGILLYISWRFEFRFAIGAVTALFHDVLITIGILSICNKEITLQILAALLTIVGYSLNDTIVVFDRIRELNRKYPKYSFEEMADRAVSETLVRSLNNSITILVMLLSLVLLGGQSIRWFSVALLIGAVTGTYSSTFTAVPLLVEWNKRSKK